MQDNYNSKPDEENKDFDPDYSPDNPHNLKVAEQKRVMFDKRKNSYIDEDGCAIFDRFGQPF